MESKGPYGYDNRTQSGPKGPQNQSGTDAWEEVCRSVAELGITVADSLNQGLKDGLAELQKNRPTTPGSPFGGQPGQPGPYSRPQTQNRTQTQTRPPMHAAQQMHQARVQMNSRVDKMAGSLGETLSNGISMMVGTVVAGAAIASAFLALGMTITGIVIGESVILFGLVFLVLGGIAVGLGLLSRWLFSLPGRRMRRRRYLAAMGDQTNVPLDRLCEAVQQPKKFVKKDISRMIRQGQLANAFLDEQEDRFFLNVAEYRELQRQQEAARRQARQQAAQQRAVEQQRQQDPAKAELMETVQQVQEFAKTLVDHIQKNGEEPLHTELTELLGKTRDILQWIQAHPGSVGKVRKFVRYYMPTTIKLLNTYDDVKKQQGDVAGGIRTEITGILHTMNRAFESLRDDLLSDAALDVSTEISAMQTMLAQDGLSVDEKLDPKE